MVPPHGASGSGRTERSTTIAMRRLAAASGSAGIAGSRSALPVTLRMRDSCRPELDQQTPRGIGAVRGKFPVGAAGTGKRRRVGMAGYRDVLRQPGQHRRHLLQQQPGLVVRHRRSERKHRLAIGVADLDAQTFRCHVDRQLACQLGQLRIVAHRIANLLRRLLEGLLLALFQFRLQFRLGRLALNIAAARRGRGDRDRAGRSGVPHLLRWRLRRRPAAQIRLLALSCRRDAAAAGRSTSVSSSSTRSTTGCWPTVTCGLPRSDSIAPCENAVRPPNGCPVPDELCDSTLFGLK